MSTELSPRSRRALILKNLKLQLETIQKENGYTTDVQKVTMDVKNWNDTAEAECPVLYIIDENTLYDYHAGNLTERTWTFGLYGVMKNKSQEEMEEFVADVEECLTKNYKLAFNGTAPISYSRIRNIITDNQLFSQLESSQLFKITIDLVYTCCVNRIR